MSCLYACYVPHSDIIVPFTLCIDLTLMLFAVKLLISNICWLPSISQYYFILDMYNISGGGGVQIHMLCRVGGGAEYAVR
jgi:hypothetical protein